MAQWSNNVQAVAEQGLPIPFANDLNCSIFGGVGQT